MLVAGAAASDSGIWDLNHYHASSVGSAAAEITPLDHAFCFPSCR